MHEEGAIHLNRTLQEIHRLGLRAGVAINPATPAGVLEEILPDVELVLVMTVNPGFGGQEFLAGVLPKIRRVRRMIDEARIDCDLEVDGGIDVQTRPRCRRGRPGPGGRFGDLSCSGRTSRRDGPAQRATCPAARSDRLSPDLEST